MMTSPQNKADNSVNDRLSAWLDGELSLEDRAQLEQELNASPELQRQLDELRRVSDLVRGLPKLAAPGELKPAIMRAVERDSLLTVRSAPSRWKQSAILKFASVAALVAIGVTVWLNRDQQQDQVAEVETPLTMSQVPGRMPANEAQPRDAVVAASNQDSDGTVKAKGFLLEKDQLNAASIGDFVKALVRNGDSVSVVRLRVVDRQESIEALELVLANEKGVRNLKDESGLVAVYIESGPDKLSEAISQMGKSIDRMELTSQIRMDELDPDFVAAMEAHQSASAPSIMSRVPFEPGSKLDQLVKGTSAAFPSESNSDPVNAGGRVRVIFLLGDKSDSVNAPANGSGAAS